MLFICKLQETLPDKAGGWRGARDKHSTYLQTGLPALQKLMYDLSGDMFVIQVKECGRDRREWTMPLLTHKLLLSILELIQRDTSSKVCNAFANAGGLQALIDCYQLRAVDLRTTALHATSACAQHSCTFKGKEWPGELLKESPVSNQLWNLTQDNRKSADAQRTTPAMWAETVLVLVAKV